MAEKLFLESGIENTRMIDIAERAGITRVTLYRYFANRCGQRSNIDRLVLHPPTRKC